MTCILLIISCRDCLGKHNIRNKDHGMSDPGWRKQQVNGTGKASRTGKSDMEGVLRWWGLLSYYALKI